MASTRRSRRSSAAEVAARRSAQQQAAARAAAEVAGAAWNRVDLGNIARSWAALLPGPLGAVTVAQRIAASGADAYVAAVAGARTPAGLVVPSRLAGIASDGRPLGSLLYTPAVRSLEAIRAGATVADAMQVGRLHLDMIVRTQVADAARVADGLAITARRDVGGYIRMLSGKSCSRCVILAGKFYRWNAGFLRHPRCDCRHMPAGRSVRAARVSDPRLNPRAAFNNMSPAEQDRIFTRAGAQSIRDGADMGRVINARRGMSTTGESRTRVNAQGLVVNERHRTRTGTATSSVARGGRRLMPETIYERAGGDREKALRMLQQQGYIVRPPVVARRPPVVPASPAPLTLAEQVATGIRTRQQLGGGITATTELVTTADGTRVVYKLAKSSAGRAARAQQDAEELGARVAQAVGLRAPEVARVSANEIYMTHLEGRTAAELSDEVVAALRVSDEGTRLGLSDLLMGNTDRNPGNLVVHDGRIGAIDHGSAFQWHPTYNRATRPPQFRNDWWSSFGDSAGWRTNPLSPADIGVLRQRLTALRPEFVRLRRVGWYNSMMSRLRAIERHAGGTGRVIT